MESVWGQYLTFYFCDAEAALDEQVKGIKSSTDPVLHVGVFRGAGRKRLYYGEGRAPEVYSVALDEYSDFQGVPRLELDLADLDLSRTYRAKKIRFTVNGEMRLTALPFAYSLRLIDSRDIAHRTLRYLDGDRWGAE